MTIEGPLTYGVIFGNAHNMANDQLFTFLGNNYQRTIDLQFPFYGNRHNMANHVEYQIPALYPNLDLQAKVSFMRALRLNY